MIGVEFDDSIAPVLQQMTGRKVICGPAGPNVVRFVPPLIISDEEADHICDIVCSLVEEV